MTVAMKLRDEGEDGGQLRWVVRMMLLSAVRVAWW